MLVRNTQRCLNAKISSLDKPKRQLLEYFHDKKFSCILSQIKLLHEESTICRKHFTNLCSEVVLKKCKSQDVNIQLVQDVKQKGNDLILCASKILQRNA